MIDDIRSVVSALALLRTRIAGGMNGMEGR